MNFSRQCTLRHIDLDNLDNFLHVWTCLSETPAGYDKVYIQETLQLASLFFPLHQEAEARADRLAGSGFVDLLQPVLGTAARGVVGQAFVQVV